MTKTIATFFLSLAFFSTMTISAQTKPTTPKEYEKLWKQVKVYDDDALPQSAQKVVEEIYNLAIADNNEKQMIKSIVYKMGYTKDLAEEGGKEAIMILESEMEHYKGIVKPFMHLLLATMYKEYYTENAYQINQRSETFGFENEDIATWSTTQFQNKIIKTYWLALDNVLKNESIIEYSEFIDQTKESANCFPTLYDFVAYHIIDQLSTATYYRYGYGNNAHSDRLKDNSYLSDVNTFVNLKIIGDTLSYSRTALMVYQNWLQFRLENSANIEALVNTDLERLSFVKNTLATADKDKIWEKALESLQKKYNNAPELAQINYDLATYYHQLGNKYNFQDSTTFQYKTLKTKAIDLLEDAITRFPEAKFAPACVNLKNEIEKINFTFQTENVVNANEKLPLRISYQNTDIIYITILKCDYDKYADLDISYENPVADLLKISEKFMDTKAIALNKTTDYNTHYTEYLADALPHGFYIILLHAKKELKIEENYFAYTSMFSSDLCMVTKEVNNNNPGLFVFNRKTGYPVENAKIELFKQEYNAKAQKYIYTKTYTTHTDKTGYAHIKTDQKERWSNYGRVDVSYKNDLISENTGFYSYPESEAPKRTEIKFFTDRAIYRPGQTVHFKGICLEKQGNDVTIASKFSTKISFKDVNWKDVETLNLVSNEYGTVAGSFTIPLGVLTGNFTIQTPNGSCVIQVEEYKRPMFEVKTLPVEGEYKINDNVTVEGEAKTYAGTALTDAKVSYTVVRSAILRPYWRPETSEEIEIAFGEVTLDGEGKFKINFKASVDEIELLRKYVAYNYTVNVTVTDINGETQTTSTSVLVANRSLELSANIRPSIIKEQTDSVSIDTKNISGVFVAAEIKIEVFKLKDHKTLLAAKQWEIVDLPLYTKEEWYKAYPGHAYNDETDFSKFEIEKTVFKHNINSATTKKIKFDGVEKWKSGVYRMVLQSVDKWGNPVEFVKEFVLFSEKDTKLPYLATEFFHIDKTSAQPGETVTLYMGSSYKDVDLFYDFGAQGKIVKSEIIKLSSEIKKIQIPIEEAYRGDISVGMFFVKNGRTYKFDQNIAVDWENKKLDIKFITFRDKTLPGAHESWQLKITDSKSQNVQAEFMASLYDASLDAFAKNYWNLNLYPKYNSRLTWNYFGFNNISSQIAFQGFFTTPFPVSIDYPYLNLFSSFSYLEMPSKGRLAYSNFEVIDDNLKLSIDFDSQDYLSENGMEVFSHKGEISAGASSQPAMQIRSNFNETAFFYPTLTTNEAGEIFLKFTMPESLTRWNFMGLAHTKDLKIGTITEEVVTQKELMVMPKLPRFFRENDKITISAKINNVSENSISGITKIEFFDVENLESLNDRFLGETISNEQNFKVEKNGNTLIEWQVTIPEGLSAVGVRITADGRNHSDGEEHILPILSNKMLVTESLPLPVRKAGTTNFTFNSLAKSGTSSTLRNESYTLEFTANPAWYAVQALPYLMEYPYECAEQVFSRFYANSLSSHIANSDPKIKRVFELWKTIPDSKALLSNLEKNQELKALLIEETPWLMNAQNETERKRKIGILFDLNRMANENNIALKKLSEMQSPTGGFSWFKGMIDSWYITQHIVGGFAHLDKLGVADVKKNATVWNMVKKSIEYLDKQLEKNYNDLKKHCNEDCLKKDNLDYMQIHYLYVRSFFMNDITLQESTKEAFNYYQNQAAKYWTSKSVYMQGMIALALYKQGEPKVPAKIVASLKERAIKSNEMGMYWKYNSGCFWYQAPIETQALLIEVFNDVANDQKSVEEMKVWLLKQKQTQDWKTTKATTEAIYALLLQGTNLLAETDFPIIKIGDKTIDVAADSDIKTEAGTGYFKQRWDGAVVDPTWGNVSVTKKENSVAWGAVYWQYFEQLDKIKQFEETPLTINKQLFVERRSGDKVVIVPIEKDASLVVGDKVKVRIEIRVDRDMEYVHLKDMRAACFEPMDYLSGYRYKAGLGYYQGIKDASMNFFIDYLSKGTYVFEYDLRVSQKGEFSNGITTMQSMYAPEFTSHSEGVRVVVRD